MWRPPLTRRTGGLAAAAVGLLIPALVVAAPGAAPVGARPTAFQSIAPAADSTGPIVTDSSGNGYVSWQNEAKNDKGDPVEFCLIPSSGTCTDPITLPLPSHTTWDDYALLQPFPLLTGAPGGVQVVAPSYVYSDVVVWTSSDGGASFAKPKVIPSPVYADNTNVDDVLLSASSTAPLKNYFSIASENSGLGYTYTGVGAIGATHPSEGFIFDTDTVAGSVAGATLGLSGPETVEAFWTDATPPALDYFWAPLPGVSGSPGTLEHGPIAVTAGTNARLAGGPDGLFLLSEDNGSKASKPLQLHVRKWNPSTHAFGKPTTVASVPNNINAANQGGFTEDSSTGALTVAWPEAGPKGTYVMDLWTSTDGGSTWSGSSTVATIDDTYSGPARLALTGGSGFLTFEDSGGLELIDLG
jgi:hypothetical protein